MEVKTTQNIDDWITLFICLFNQPPSYLALHDISNSVRRSYVVFHINWKLCQQTSSSLLHYSQNFNFPLHFPLKEKYFTLPQNKNTKSDLVKGKGRLGVSSREGQRHETLVETSFHLSVGMTFGIQSKYFVIRSSYPFFTYNNISYYFVI
jgi:hypothetical protein